jgi:GDP-L-fucose synthase
MNSMTFDSEVLVCGARGLVGSAIVRELKKRGYNNILTPTRTELDFLKQSDVFDFFKFHRPKFIFMAAAKVGGIVANNKYRADFIYENLTIQNNLFGAALKYPVDGFLFLGSSCIYPRDCSQPMKEEYLLTSPLEKTNEPYAIAKIAGLKTAESIRRQYGSPFFSVMPTNLYGPNDNYHPENSHVIPGLIRRMHEAKIRNEKEFVVWGSGKPRREFLYVDDLAKACIFLMHNPKNNPDLINVGCGEDITIKDLAILIQEAVGYKGSLKFDVLRPDGTPQKLLDISKVRKLGWSPKIRLRDGLNLAYCDFLIQLGRESISSNEFEKRQYDFKG